MKVRLWQAFGTALIAAFYLQFPLVAGCSKDQQATDQMETDQQGDAADGDQNAENAKQGQTQTAAEGNDTAPVADDAAAKADGGADQAAAGGEGNINAVENQASDEQVAQASADQPPNSAEQQQDLQEIIEDMNKNGSPQGADAAAQATPAPEAGAQPAQVAQATAPAGGQAQAAAPGGGQAQAAAAPSQDAPQQQQAATAPAAPGLPETGSKMAYVVQKGDSLGTIAQRVYGDKAKWKEIADFTGLANPSLIYPGDVVYYQLTDQTKAYAVAYESASRSEVEVQPGDTLSTISGRVLGSPADWRLIWRQNDNINDPDKLVVGTKLYYISRGTMAETVKVLKNKFAGEKSASHDFSASLDEGTQTTNNMQVIGSELNNSTVLNAHNDTMQMGMNSNMGNVI